MGGIYFGLLLALPWGTGFLFNLSERGGYPGAPLLPTYF